MQPVSSGRLNEYKNKISQNISPALFAHLRPFFQLLFTSKVGRDSPRPSFKMSGRINGLCRKTKVFLGHRNSWQTFEMLGQTTRVLDITIPAKAQPDSLRSNDRKLKQPRQSEVWKMTAWNWYCRAEMLLATILISHLVVIANFICY